MSDGEDQKVGPKFPYKAEYAKSGRAACKKCKEKIAKDTLRVAIMVRAWAFDGFQPHWYHKSCFFQKAAPDNVDQVEDFYKLRPEDQNKLKEMIETGGISVSTSKSSKKGSKKGKTEIILNNKFNIQYAPSGRAKCRNCGEKIEKDEIRISKKQIDPEKAHLGLIDRWFRVGCFLQKRHELNWDSQKFMPENIPGFDILEKEDKEQLNVLFEKARKKDAKKLAKSEAEGAENSIKTENGAGPSGSSSSSGVKSEAASSQAKAEAKHKKLFDTQNKIIWKTKDAMKDITKNDLIDILNHNCMPVPESGNAEKYLDRVIDAILFGKIAKCSECEAGTIVADTYEYQCRGYISGFTACNFTSLDPKRTEESFKVGPPYLLNKYPILKKIKLPVKKQVRLFPR